MERLRAHHEATFEHGIRVGLLAAELAQMLGFTREFVLRTQLIGDLHDVGKILVPVDLLDAPRALRPEEWQTMRAHARHTRTLLREQPHLAEFADDAAFHHERLDGSGYPYGLTGSNISMTTRIVTVADMYDAMTHRRPYHLVDPVPIVLDTIRDGAGKWWEPAVVDALAEHVKSGTQRSHESDNTLRAGAQKGPDEATDDDEIAQ